MTKEERIEKRKKESEDILKNNTDVIAEMAIEYINKYHSINNKLLKDISQAKPKIISLETNNDELSNYLDCLGFDAFLKMGALQLGISNRVISAGTRDILRVYIKRQNVTVNELDKLKAYERIENELGTFSNFFPVLNVQTKLDRNRNPRLIILTENTQIVKFLKNHEHVFHTDTMQEDGAVYYGICQSTAVKKGMNMIIKELKPSWVTTS